MDTSGQTESCSKTTVHRPPLGAGADIENIGRSVGGGGGWGKNEFNIGFIRILPEQMLPGVSVSRGRTGLLFFPTSNCSKFLPISCNFYGIKEFSSHLNSLIDIAFI